MTEKITLKLDYSQPVELVDLSLALLSFGNEYARFSNTSEQGIPESKLYLHKIEQGSIIAEFVAIASQGSVFIDNATALQGFALKLQEVIGYFLGGQKDKPAMDKKQLDQYEAFLQPVAKDPGGQWLISGNENVNITINHIEANAIQNGIKRERELLKEPVSGLHEQVVLVFKQTSGDSPKVGNRAVVESISKNKVKTVFADKSVHDDMLMGVENPLTGGYLVDVRVETIDDKPALYKILRFHERIG